MGPTRTLLSVVMASLALGRGSPDARAAEPPQPDDPVTAHAEPRWLKGNLHTHSLWSDGNDYPERIVDWYARHGYQFLALSDHNVLSQGPRWMSVAEANKRVKQDGFARYRQRFGDAWVETRTENGALQVRLKPLGEYRTLFERPGRFLLIQGEEITDNKLIANPKLTDEQRKKVAGAVDRNNSDVDFCEFQGKTIITYSWGNQQGTEFLAGAVYDGTLACFLRGFFP